MYIIYKLFDCTGALSGGYPGGLVYTVPDQGRAEGTRIPGIPRQRSAPGRFLSPTPNSSLLSWVLTQTDYNNYQTDYNNYYNLSTGAKDSPKKFSRIFRTKNQRPRFPGAIRVGEHLERQGGCNSANKDQLPLRAPAPDIATSMLCM